MLYIWHRMFHQRIHQIWYCVRAVERIFCQMAREVPSSWTTDNNRKSITRSSMEELEIGSLMEVFGVSACLLNFAIMCRLRSIAQSQ